LPIHPAITIAVALPYVLTPVLAIGNAAIDPPIALSCEIDIPISAIRAISAIRTRGALYGSIVHIAIDAIHPAVLPVLGTIAAGFDPGLPVHVHLSAIVPILSSLHLPRATVAIAAAFGAPFAATIALQGDGAGQVCLNQSGRAVEIGGDFGGGCGGGRQHRGRHQAGD
tara:strand:- start:5904 stop:6410 length:507 start_codon:yes stop_codon:yes gene_type:complete